MPTLGENHCARWIAPRRKGLRPHGKSQRKYCRRLGLHPVVERSTLRRSVVNFQGTSFRWSHRGKTKTAGSVNENPQIPAQGRRGPVSILFGGDYHTFR